MFIFSALSDNNDEICLIERLYNSSNLTTIKFRRMLMHTPELFIVD